MCALFSPIKAPPQDLDTLDDWGSVDELLWSLDSDIWNQAGLYSLEDAVGTGETGEDLAAVVRIRAGAGQGSGVCRGTMQGNVVLSLAGSGSAFMDGEQIGGITVGIPVSPTYAMSSSNFFMLRIQHGWGGGIGVSDDEFLPYRVRMTGLTGLETRSSEKEEPNRIRCVIPDPSVGKAESLIIPEYKGWGWAQIERNIGVWTGVVQWQ